MGAPKNFSSDRRLTTAEATDYLSLSLPPERDALTR